MKPNLENPIWLSPKAIAEIKQWPIGGIRHLLFHAQKNGFARCVRRIGRKVLINQHLFDQFIEEHGVKR